jgi:fructose-1,6-bisphosphatase/inositol monophosphatase family enzyme
MKPFTRTPVPGFPHYCVSIASAATLRLKGQQHTLCGRVPTIAEVLRLARRRIWAGSSVGVYVETKEPAFHVAKNLNLEPR